jgi:hypothetical protein
VDKNQLTPVKSDDSKDTSQITNPETFNEEREEKDPLSDLLASYNDSEKKMLASLVKSNQQVSKLKECLRVVHDQYLRCLDAVEEQVYLCLLLFVCLFFFLDLFKWFVFFVYRIAFYNPYAAILFNSMSSSSGTFFSSYLSFGDFYIYTYNIMTSPYV